MKKIPICLMLVFLIASCGGKSGSANNTNGEDGNGTEDGTENGGEANPNLRMLASNVILGSASASALKNESSEEVDTTTQVLAENVILDTTANNRLASDNLQSALNDELAVDVADIIVGNWSCTTYGTPGTVSSTVIFNADGSWSVSGCFGLTNASSEPSGCYIYNNATTLTPASYSIVGNFMINFVVTSVSNFPCFVYSATLTDLILVSPTAAAVGSYQGAIAVCAKNS